MGRIMGVLLVLAALAAVVVGTGTAGRSPQAAQQDYCPTTRSAAPGWRAIFGHTTTLDAAYSLLARVQKKNFQHTVAEPNCAGGYDVVLRGICPFSAARGLQAEAKRAKYAVVLQYKKPPDTSPNLVVVFRHFRTRAAAEDFVPRVQHAGFQHVTVFNDGACNGDWEVLVESTTNRAQTEDLANEARGAGFAATVEYQ
jgi:hypothetical protein